MSPGLWAVERVFLARAPGRAWRVAVDIVADRQRREFLARLPLGGKRRRPARIAVEIPLPVGELERAVRSALEHDVAANSQDDEIHVAVAGDVDWIGADDVLKQFGIGADVERLFLEFERPAGFRTIDEEPRRVLASSQEHRGKAGAVAVERRPAAADEKFPRAVVDAVEARGLGLLVHQRHVADRPRPTVLRRGRRRATRSAPMTQKTIRITGPR